MGDNERTERVLFWRVPMPTRKHFLDVFLGEYRNRTVTVLSKIINSVPDTSVIFGTLISGERGHK